MGVMSRVDRVSFAGGENGDAANARADTARYQISVEKCEGYIVMKQGGLTRAPGTRFVLELKDQSQRGKLIPFRRSSTDYLMLAINGGVSRFLKDGGFVQNVDTTPYEMSVPWVEPDLSSLRYASAGNTIYVASNKAPKQIVRSGPLSWAVSDYAPANGPVDTANVDKAKTIQASAATGAGITLTGVGTSFGAAQIGGVYRLEDRDLSLTPSWSPTEEAIATGQLRRWNGNVYEAMLSGKAAGPNAPSHTEGDVSAGKADATTEYQTWRFRHPGYGFVRITAVASALSATADVLTELPATVVSGATYRWAAPAWTSDLGFPTWVSFRYPKLFWSRGNIAWGTADDDALNFDLARGDDTDAIAIRIVAPDGSLVDIQWMAPSGPQLIGTSDLEWVLRGANVFDPITPKGAKPFPLGTDGSEPQIPTLVDGGVMFVGKTARRLHYTKFDTQTQQLDSTELSVTAEHIFGVKVVGSCWQRDPNRILWMWFEDGTMASFTFMPAQQIGAFCRHPRKNLFVEDMACIPSTSSGTDQVYIIARRTINGETKRYVELMADYFRPLNAAAPTAAGAWFLDSALRVTGVNMTSITQLAHLEGQEVGVFADGVMQARKTVEGGTIALDRPSQDVLVGLPIRCYVRDLPRNFNTAAGSTTGDIKTIHKALVHLKDSGSGRIRVYDPDRLPSEDEDLWENVFETGGSGYAPNFPLKTVRKPVDADGSMREEAQLEFECDDALPSTILALSPVIDVVEGD